MPGSDREVLSGFIFGVSVREILDFYDERVVDFWHWLSNRDQFIVG
jgi:hypothetical protein